MNKTIFKFKNLDLDGGYRVLCCKRNEDDPMSSEGWWICFRHDVLRYGIGKAFDGMDSKEYLTLSDDWIELEIIDEVYFFGILVKNTNQLFGFNHSFEFLGGNKVYFGEDPQLPALKFLGEIQEILN
jgi:hypothetical protein